MTPVYWEGAVFFQRKVWPVGNVRGSESSCRVMFRGIHTRDLEMLVKWRVWVWGVGGVEGGGGSDLGDLFLFVIALNWIWMVARFNEFMCERKSR